MIFLSFYNSTVTRSVWKSLIRITLRAKEKNQHGLLERNHHHYKHKHGGLYDMVELNKKPTSPTYHICIVIRISVQV